MTKYALNSQIAKLSKEQRLKLNPKFLKTADKVMANAYECLYEESDISFDRIKINDEFDIFVIQPLLFDRSLNHRPIIYYHGGAFLYRGWKNNFQTACEYARETKSIVFYVDYRLAYNNEFDVVLNDCFKAYEWVLSKARYYGLNLDNIVLAGDSAGGYLALKVAEYVSMNNIMIPNKMLLMYPLVDSSMRTESMKEFVDTPLWDAELNKEMWSYVLKDNQVKSLLDCDFSFIKNWFIETCEFDCLRDEGKILAENLKKQGANVTLNETLGTCHSYDVDLKLDIVKNSLKRRFDFIKIDE